MKIQSGWITAIGLSSAGLVVIGGGVSRAAPDQATTLADARKAQSDLLAHLHAAPLHDTRPRALADHAVLACAHAPQPLTLEALAVAVSRSGYSTRAKDLRPYLRHVLRRDVRFVPTLDRRWMLDPGPSLTASL